MWHVWGLATHQVLYCTCAGSGLVAAEPDATSSSLSKAFSRCLLRHCPCCKWLVQHCMSVPASHTPLAAGARICSCTPLPDDVRLVLCAACAGAPVRLPVQDVFKGRQGGTCVGGKLEAGALRPGSKVLVVPGYVTASVKGLEVNSQVRGGGSGECGEADALSACLFRAQRCNTQTH